MPRKVKLALTGMGISVFDNKLMPVTNLLYQMLDSWVVDHDSKRRVRGFSVSQANVPQGVGDVYFRTAGGGAICAVMTTHAATMKKAVRRCSRRRARRGARKGFRGRAAGQAVDSCTA